MPKKTEKSEIQMELDDLAILLTVLSEKIHNLSYYEYLQTEQNDGLRQRLHKIIQIHSNYVTLEHSMFLIKNYPNLQPYFPDAVLALTQEKTLKTP